MNRPEDAFHIEVVSFLRMALPDDALVAHSPNGGWRLFSEAARFKKMGVVAGWPDLVVVHGGKAMFLELKAARGRLSDAQRLCHEKLRAAGCPVEVVKTLEQVVAALDAASVPLRARIAA